MPMIILRVMILLLLSISIQQIMAQRVVTPPPPPDHSQPITLTVANNSAFDLELTNVKTENISPEDLERLQSSAFYRHSNRSFTFRRTGYPAYIFLVFRVSATEENSAGYNVAQWEYAEDANRARVCHFAEAVKPFGIGCSGDDDIRKPDVNIAITYVPPPRPVPTFPLPSP